MSRLRSPGIGIGIGQALVPGSNFELAWLLGPVWTSLTTWGQGWVWAWLYARTPPLARLELRELRRFKLNENSNLGVVGTGTGTRNSKGPIGVPVHKQSKDSPPAHVELTDDRTRSQQCSEHFPWIVIGFLLTSSSSLERGSDSMVRRGNAWAKSQ